MKHWIAALLVLFVTLPAVGLAEDKRAWKLVSDRDGIQIFMAHNDDSRIKTFRGVTEFEQDDYFSSIAILDDYDFYSRWMYLISDLREVRRRSPIDRDVAVKTKLPWPVANRDAGLQLTVNQDPKSGAILIEFKARGGIIPATSNYVRIPEMAGHFNTIPIGGKRVRVEFEVLLDPGGYIPAFLANFILKDIPFVSLQRYRRVINTDRFKGHSADYISLPDGWKAQGR